MGAEEHRQGGARRQGLCVARRRGVHGTAYMFGSFYGDAQARATETLMAFASLQSIGRFIIFLGILRSERGRRIDLSQC